MSDRPSDRVPPLPRPHDPRPSVSAEDSLGRIWRRVRRPVDPHGALEALVGIPRRTTHQVVGAATAGSDEATTLLRAMPRLIRNLSISTVAVPERSNGAIRGPILWSETLSARAASAGDPGIFVCATVNRAYDTPENRLLVAALEAIVRGGREVERFHDDEADEPELLLDARRHADQAQRYLDHRTLINVRSPHGRRRASRRVRHDSRRRSYRPVAAMLERAAEPLDIPTIRLFCNEITTARHDLLIAAVDHLESRGVRIPTFLVVDRQLVAGPVRFLHPSLVARSGHHDAGLHVGTTRLDVPGGLAQQAGVHVIRNRGALASAIDEAIVHDGL